jgi:hypothetical protein
MTIATQHYLETFRGKQSPAALANATGLAVVDIERYLSSSPPPPKRKPHKYLTHKEIKSLRARARAGARTGELARAYGVHRGTIANIIAGRTREVM